LPRELGVVTIAAGARMGFIPLAVRQIRSFLRAHQVAAA
jgi:hypothetical protein